MRHALSISCFCLSLIWATPALAGDGQPTPIPPKPTMVQLPSDDDPIAANALPKPERRRDRRSDSMVIVGSLLLGSGATVGLVGARLWRARSLRSFLFEDPRLPPELPIMTGIGLASAVTGAVLLGVGVARHVRWKKANLEMGTARVRLQPTIGFGEIGIVGRF